jgi:nitrogen fixation NifU-like protein
MIDPLYRDEIIEHYKYPQNFGKLKQYDKTATQLNPFCGDEITMYIKFTQKIVKEISFTGKGCAISIAGMSILSEHMKGKTKAQLTNMDEKDMLNLLGVEVSETRKKCALLGWAVMQDCLQ